MGDYDFMTTYGTWANAYGFNGVPVQGLMFTMGNELLTWETAKTFNIGVDATFFKNTLSVNFDYFYKRTEDILLSPIVPGTFGASIAKENRALFEFVRDRIMAELNGEVKPEERITQLDSLVLPAAAPAAEGTEQKE